MEMRTDCFSPVSLFAVLSQIAGSQAWLKVLDRAVDHEHSDFIQYPGTRCKSVAVPPL